MLWRFLDEGISSLLVYTRRTGRPVFMARRAVTGSVTISIFPPNPPPIPGFTTLIRLMGRPKIRDRLVLCPNTSWLGV